MTDSSRFYKNVSFILFIIQTFENFLIVQLVLNEELHTSGHSLAELARTLLVK